MRQDFRQANAYLLAEGGLLAPDGSRAGRVPDGALVLLSRALCRFELFRAPNAASARAADGAALIWAETNAPFSDAGGCVSRGVAGYGVWWWDTARISALLPPGGGARRVTFLPETLAHMIGEGFRIVALVDGFEAQYWRDATLVASTWRRRPFDAAAWAIFLDSLPAGLGGEAAPLADAETPDYRISSIAKTLVRPRTSAWKRAEPLAYALSGVMLVFAAFLAARAAHLETFARTETSRAAEILSAADGLRGAADAMIALDTRSLWELSAKQDLPSPVLGFDRASEILARSGKGFDRIAIEEGAIQLEVSPLTGAELEAIAADLENDPVFTGVSPQLDSVSGKAVLIAALCRATDDNGCRRAND